MASRDEVVFAFRYLLNREPEAEAVIQGFEGEGGDWRRLRELFTACPEYVHNQLRATGADAALIGRHMDADHDPVQANCSPDELRQMLARISANWRRFGETEPFWSVIPSSLYRRAAIAENLESFYEGGRIDVERALNFLRRNDVPTRFARAMDFGCGVGRLTRALAPYAGAVVGVDISDGHLREARAMADREQLAHVAFERINAVEDLERLGSFDFIVSRLVLQHNPPPVMAAIYARLLAALRPGGVSVIQIPTFIKGQRFAVADYLQGESPDMEMNALPQREIFRIIAEQGCLPVEVREDDHLGTVDGLSHVFMVMRPA